jgi:apolipoprotein N-acyltransferase
VVRVGNPDLLVNITNDAWFGDTTEPWEHLALAQLRAVEHRRFLVRATNSGVSGIVDAAGRLVLHGGTFREEALLGEVRFLRASTGYELWGDKPFWLGAGLVLVMGFVSRRRAARPRSSAPS